MYQGTHASTSAPDELFIEAFETCELPNGAFHHADHVRLAWLYLRRLTLLEAIERYTGGLKRFATANGAPEKYHETITWAYLLIIHQRMAHADSCHSWDEFAAANSDLMDWSPSVLEKYYRRETLASETARLTFVLPDRGLDIS